MSSSHRSLLARFGRRTTTASPDASDLGRFQPQTPSPNPDSPAIIQSIRQSKSPETARTIPITTDTNYKPTNGSCLWTMKEILTTELANLALTLASLPGLSAQQTSMTLSHEVEKVFTMGDQLFGLEKWLEGEKVRASSSDTLKHRYKGSYDEQLQELSALVSSEQTKADIGGLISLGKAMSAAEGL